MSSTQTTEPWIDDFILTLRLREARGDAIGDAVAVVRGHVADSGESAHEAFGDPRTYAEELDLPRVQSVDWSSAGVMAPAVSLVAILVLGPAASAVFGGSLLRFSLPQLGLFLVPLVLMLAVPYYIGYAVRHLWVLALVFVLGIGAATLEGFFAPQHGTPAFVSLEPVWMLAVAAAAIVLMTAWQFRRALTDDMNPVVDPLQPSPAPERRERLAAVLPALFIPAGAPIVLAVAWLAL